MHLWSFQTENYAGHNMQFALFFFILFDEIRGSLNPASLRESCPIFHMHIKLIYPLLDTRAEWRLKMRRSRGGEWEVACGPCLLSDAPAMTCQEHANGRLHWPPSPRSSVSTNWLYNARRKCRPVPVIVSLRKQRSQGPSLAVFGLQAPIHGTRPAESFPPPSPQDISASCAKTCLPIKVVPKVRLVQNTFSVVNVGPTAGDGAGHGAPGAVTMHENPFMLSASPRVASSGVCAARAEFPHHASMAMARAFVNPSGHDPFVERQTLPHQHFHTLPAPPVVNQPRVAAKPVTLGQVRPDPNFSTWHSFRVSSVFCSFHRPKTHQYRVVGSGSVTPRTDRYRMLRNLPRDQQPHYGRSSS